MAAAKKATARKAPGKPGTGLAKYDEELARLAEASADVEASVGGSPYIKTKGGQLEYNGGLIPGNKMNVIVLDHVIEYTYYLDSYDANNPGPPAAYALGRDEKTLTWSDDSVEPYAGTLCADSDINQFGSADTGRGKAAKNSRRLALLPEDALEDIANAEIAMLKVPVTSVKGWAGYVRQLKDTLKKPPLAVITEISLVPDAQTQFKMQFKLIGTIDDGETIGELLAKAKEADHSLMQGYDMSERPEPKPARGGRGSKVQARGRSVPVAAQKAAAKKSAAPARRR